MCAGCTEPRASASGQTLNLLLAIALAALTAAAQQSAAPAPQNGPAPSPATREMRHRFNLVATRATANFRAADSIEQSLGARGLALHPQLVALRLRIETSLDEAEAAIGQGDLSAAAENLDRAEAFLSRFAKRIGGD
jgi:hypothetical protein